MNVPNVLLRHCNSVYLVYDYGQVPFVWGVKEIAYYSFKLCSVDRLDFLPVTLFKIQI